MKQAKTTNLKKKKKIVVAAAVKDVKVVEANSKQFR